MPSTISTKLKLSKLTEKIRAAESILLTTHKQCDGDGLGSLLGVYHALKKIGKDVRAMTVDEIPRKYNFLNPLEYIEVFEGPHKPIQKTDIALIFDTNDRRLVSPLFEELMEKTKLILFVDHHPILNQGPEPTPESYIDTSAASTGEISFYLIKSLGIRLDQKIARALYTSIAFDTQIFKFIRSSATSHLVAAELLDFERHPEEVHRALFSTHTPEKVSYLAKVLGSIEYFANYQIAILEIKKDDLDKYGLEMDDARDVIDMVMNISSIQVAALFREDSPSNYKLSLRSKGKIEVLSMAESFDGGGHAFASGATLNGPFIEVKERVLQLILRQVGVPGPNR